MAFRPDQFANAVTTAIPSFAQVRWIADYFILLGMPTTILLVPLSATAVKTLFLPALSLLMGVKKTPAAAKECGNYIAEHYTRLSLADRSLIQLLFAAHRAIDNNNDEGQLPLPVAPADGTTEAPSLFVFVSYYCRYLWSNDIADLEFPRYPQSPKEDLLAMVQHHVNEISSLVINAADDDDDDGALEQLGDANDTIGSSSSLNEIKGAFRLRVHSEHVFDVLPSDFQDMWSDVAKHMDPAILNVYLSDAPSRSSLSVFMDAFLKATKASTHPLTQKGLGPLWETIVRSKIGPLGCINMEMNRAELAARLFAFVAYTCRYAWWNIHSMGPVPFVNDPSVRDDIRTLVGLHTKEVYEACHEPLPELEQQPWHPIPPSDVYNNRFYAFQLFCQLPSRLMGIWLKTEAFMSDELRTIYRGERIPGSLVNDFMFRFVAKMRQQIEAFPERDALQKGILITAQTTLARLQQASRYYGTTVLVSAEGESVSFLNDEYLNTYFERSALGVVPDTATKETTFAYGLIEQSMDRRVAGGTDRIRFIEAALSRSFVKELDYLKLVARIEMLHASRFDVGIATGKAIFEYVNRLQTIYNATRSTEDVMQQIMALSTKTFLVPLSTRHQRSIVRFDPLVGLECELRRQYIIAHPGLFTEDMVETAAYFESENPFEDDDDEDDEEDEEPGSIVAIIKHKIADEPGRQISSVTVLLDDMSVVKVKWSDPRLVSIDEADGQVLFDDLYVTYLENVGLWNDAFEKDYEARLLAKRVI